MKYQNPIDIQNRTDLIIFLILTPVTPNGVNPDKVTSKIIRV